MIQNVFKIYDGRTNFWQWDTNQKLIVLDKRITEVHFSNKSMSQSIRKEVYVDEDGCRVCKIPSELLQIGGILNAHAYMPGMTTKVVKFAIQQRPMPSDYITDQDDSLEDRLAQIYAMLENLKGSKADDIHYNEESNSIQLVANGELVGSRVELPKCDIPGIDNCEVNEEGHLVVTLTNGHIIDAGFVGNENGATFIPYISEDLVLSWTNDKGLENPPPVDIAPFGSWIEFGDSGEAGT